jgi:hypothetical protein
MMVMGIVIVGNDHRARIGQRGLVPREDAQVGVRLRIRTPRGDVVEGVGA